ncbi:MAG: mandelate racemase/muconate lactonizing enzyme family protein, partial [Gemmataceae bacterium]
EPIPVCVPLKQGLTTRTAHGDHVVSAYVLVRVHTDQGLVGLGEATVAPRWTGETSRSCVAALDELVGPALVGKDPSRITALRAVMDRELKLNPFTKAAVEMALWDLAGKAAGKPVYDLLGGKVRDLIPIKMVIGGFGVDEACALAERFLTWGVRCLKVKVGLDPDGDVARVAAVRRVAGPAVPIGVDANCGWDRTTALRTLRRLAEYDLLFAEQPIPPGDPAALASVRRDQGIPVMADESVFTLTDAWQLAAHQAADVLSVYPGKHGGIAGTVEVAHVAKAAGLACAIGSNLELGVGTAAMLHVAAALPVIASERYPADAIGPLYHESDLLTTPLELGPVAAKVPSGPGLGVELDEDQIRRWRQG